MRGLLLGVLRAVGILAYSLGLARWIIGLRRRSARIVLYHATEADESIFLRGLDSNVRPERFAEQMEFVRDHYSVVTDSTVIEDSRPDCALCITFDDGYRSLLSGAIPALRANRFPATIYLVASAVDNTALIWVNELNWLLRQHWATCAPLVAASVNTATSIAPQRLIAHVREQLRPTEISDLLIRLRAATGLSAPALAASSALYLTWHEARELQQESMRFGSHSATHPNLAKSSAAECESELREAHAVITRELGSCRSFAYPFGAVSPAARRTAMALGYDSVMEVSVNTTVGDPLQLSRVAAPDAGAATLFAELEFVHPLKSWLRRTSHRLRSSTTSR